MNTIFFKQEAIDDLEVMGSSLPILGTATENAHYPRLSRVLGTQSCRKIDDVSRVQQSIQTLWKF